MLMNLVLSGGQFSKFLKIFKQFCADYSDYSMNYPNTIKNSYGWHVFLRHHACELIFYNTFTLLKLKKKMSFEPLKVKYIIFSQQTCWHFTAGEAYSRCIDFFEVPIPGPWYCTYWLDGAQNGTYTSAFPAMTSQNI